MKITVKNNLIRLTQTAILSALAVILSVIEGLIPLPFALPGMRLGLSNLAVMFSLELMPLPCALCIVIIKSLFALLTRGATAAVLSLAGGLLSTLTMLLLVRSRKLHFGCLGIGIGGAFMHNCGQLLASAALVGNAAFVYAPLLSLVSLATGALTGLVLYLVLPALKRIPFTAAGGHPS